jgi:hypothetical protein
MIEDLTTWLSVVKFSGLRYKTKVNNKHDITI